MVEITMRRCFVLWTQDKQGNTRFEPIVFTSAAAAINQGECQQEKGLIADYNYSVVMQPQMGAEVEIKKPLTSEPRAPSLSL